MTVRTLALRAAVLMGAVVASQTLSGSAQAVPRTGAPEAHLSPAAPGSTTHDPSQVAPRAKDEAFGPVVPHLVGTIETLRGEASWLETADDALALRVARHAEPAVHAVYDGSEPAETADSCPFSAPWGWWPAASTALTAQLSDLLAWSWTMAWEQPEPLTRMGLDWHQAQDQAQRVDEQMLRFVAAHDGIGADSSIGRTGPRNNLESLAVLESWCQGTLVADLLVGLPPAQPQLPPPGHLAELLLGPFATLDPWLASFTGRQVLDEPRGASGFATIIAGPTRYLYLRDPDAETAWATPGVWAGAEALDAQLPTPLAASTELSGVDSADTGWPAENWVHVPVETALAGPAPGRGMSEQQALELLRIQAEALRPWCRIWANLLSRGSRWTRELSQGWLLAGSASPGEGESADPQTGEGNRQSSSPTERAASGHGESLRLHLPALPAPLEPMDWSDEIDFGR